MPSPSQHRVSVRSTRPLVEIVVTEELTELGAARLRMLLADALALQPRAIVVDLAACPRADAPGVDVLLNIHRWAYDLGSRVVLRAPSEGVRRVLRLARLDRVFDIDDNPSSGPPLLRRQVEPIAWADEER